jgi:hypothetical protein
MSVDGAGGPSAAARRCWWGALVRRVALGAARLASPVATSPGPVGAGRGRRWAAWRVQVLRAVRQPLRANAVNQRGSRLPRWGVRIGVSLSTGCARSRGLARGYVRVALRAGGSASSRRCPSGLWWGGVSRGRRSRLLKLSPSGLGRACVAGQETTEPGGASVSGVRRMTRRGASPWAGSLAARSMPWDSTPRRVRGARLATMTMDFPTRSAGS